ncbi:hypothetical protein [Rhizobium phage RHph_X2_26]|nr:hypothetical protein [Rhizobium phage RHph_X2_26]
MKLYALQDSDWGFDSEEFPAIFVEAESSQEAARLASERLVSESEADSPCGGVHWKIAEVKIVAFCGATWEDGKIEVDEELRL